MSITTLSSRQFSQDASMAKRAAFSGPVFITDRGRPAHVLMTFEDYQKINKQKTNIADLLAMPGIENIPFDAPKWTEIARPADLA